jgi:hypothetical protein
MRICSAILSIILAFSLFFLGCKSVKPSEPDYVASKKTFVRELSVINLPVEVPLKTLEDQVNKRMGNLIYEDQSYTSPSVDDLKLIVLKKRPITVSISGTDLLFTIPLNIWGKGRWEACSFCPTIEKETSFDVDVYLKSKVEIQKNYQFKVTTSSGGFEWKSKPVISLGPLNIPIDRLIEGVLDKQIGAVTKEIDSQINGAVNLRSQVEDIWKLAQEPILLDDSTKTWIRIDPERLFMAPVTGNKTLIRIPLGIEAYIETVTGAKPAPVKLKPLPELKQIAKGSNSFVVQVRSQLGFEEATRIATSQLGGQEFAYGKKKIKAEAIRIYGKGDRAFIHLIFSGSLKGELFLSGIPSYNSETDEFSFTELDYDINSKNLLVKTGSWLLNSTFKNMMQEKLKFSFKPEMDQLRKSMRESLKNYTYKDLFTLKGELGKMNVQDVYVTGNQFDMALLLRGTANLKINNLGF